MKRELRHICQSVDGALSNWTMKEWKSVAKENNLTVAELKDVFRKYKADGKRVIPLGEPCEGFSYWSGCPGHEVDEV